MPSTWKDVWASRSLDPGHGSLLAQVMAADGLDTKFGSVTEASWCAFVRRTAAVMGINAGSSVFEVGCGAGAYLLDLYERGCEVAGLDASPAMIRCAERVMPRGRWTVADAGELDPSEQYDFVAACGVFLYFPSFEYAADVLDRMVRKARNGILVLDVPDLDKEETAMALRRSILGEANYARKYDGLKHLYYPRNWFESRLSGLGIDRIQIEDQSIEGYANSTYRYNVFAWHSRDGASQ